MKEVIFMPKRKKIRKLRKENKYITQGVQNEGSSNQNVEQGASGGWGFGGVVNGATGLAASALGLVGSAMADFGNFDGFDDGDDLRKGTGPKCRLYKQGFGGKSREEEEKITNDCINERAMEKATTTTTAVTKTTPTTIPSSTLNGTDWSATTQGPGGEDSWWWPFLLAGSIVVSVGIAFLLYNKYCRGNGNGNSEETQELN